MYKLHLFLRNYPICPPQEDPRCSPLASAAPSQPLSSTVKQKPLLLLLVMQKPLLLLLLLLLLSEGGTPVLRRIADPPRTWRAPSFGATRSDCWSPTPPQRDAMADQAGPEG